MSSLQQFNVMPDVGGLNAKLRRSLPSQGLFPEKD
jgi:hypothetical protein